MQEYCEFVGVHGTGVAEGLFYRIARSSDALDLDACTHRRIFSGAYRISFVRFAFASQVRSFIAGGAIKEMAEPDLSAARICLYFQRSSIVLTEDGSRVSYPSSACRLGDNRFVAGSVL